MFSATFYESEEDPGSVQMEQPFSGLGAVPTSNTCTENSCPPVSRRRQIAPQDDVIRNIGTIQRPVLDRRIIYALNWVGLWHDPMTPRSK
ncbi:unnamed protein product [Onchocerca flexuosa]|uniref:Uncharacterized protein n=1 Tax=Onchocerca flexuosa TaxID=387005 RepID=A0A183I4T3_9BILA|nr:unnamed protein product [Onchocerca flexuosa]